MTNNRIGQWAETMTQLEGDAYALRRASQLVAGATNPWWGSAKNVALGVIDDAHANAQQAIEEHKRAGEAMLAPPQGVAVVPLSDTAGVADAIAHAVGEETPTHCQYCGKYGPSVRTPQGYSAHAACLARRMEGRFTITIRRDDSGIWADDGGMAWRLATPADFDGAPRTGTRDDLIDAPISSATNAPLWDEGGTPCWGMIDDEPHCLMMYALLVAVEKAAAKGEIITVKE